MDTPEPTLNQSVASVLATVPKPVRDFLTGPERERLFSALRRKYRLNDEQADAMERQLITILLGIIAPTAFADALMNTGVSAEMLAGLTQDINAQVFKPLQEKIKNLPKVTESTAQKTAQETSAPKTTATPTPVPPPKNLPGAPQELLLEDHEEPSPGLKAASMAPTPPTSQRVIKLPPTWQAAPTPVATPKPTPPVSNPAPVTNPVPTLRSPEPAIPMPQQKPPVMIPAPAPVRQIPQPAAWTMPKPSAPEAPPTMPTRPLTQQPGFAPSPFTAPSSPAPRPSVPTPRAAPQIDPITKKYAADPYREPIDDK